MRTSNHSLKKKEMEDAFQRRIEDNSGEESWQDFKSALLSTLESKCGTTKKELIQKEKNSMVE